MQSKADQQAGNISRPALNDKWTILQSEISTKQEWLAFGAESPFLRMPDA